MHEFSTAATPPSSERSEEIIRPASVACHDLRSLNVLDLVHSYFWVCFEFGGCIAQVILWSVGGTSGAEFEAAWHKCLPHSGPCGWETVGVASGRQEVSKII